MTPTRDTETRTAFVAAVKAWAERMDQWEKIKFPTKHGTVYVTVSRASPFPYSFDEV